MFESVAGLNLFLKPGGTGFYQKCSIIFCCDSVEAGEHYFGGERGP